MIEHIVETSRKALSAKVERALFPRDRHWQGLVYQASPYTRKAFLEMLEYTPDLRQTVDYLNQKLTAAALSFACELFARVYFRSTPKVPVTQPAFRWAAAYHDTLATVPAFKRFQRMYEGDEEGAAVATVQLLRAFIDTLPDDVVRSDTDPNTDPDDDAPSQPSPDVLAAAEDGDEDAQEIIKRAKEALAEYNAAKQAQELAAQAANRDIIQNIGRVRRQIATTAANAVDKAGKIVSDSRALFAGMGLVDETPAGGSVQKLSAGAKAALARGLQDNRRLKKILLAAGRMRLIAANKQRGVRQHGWDEVASVELGADIPRVVPAQLLGLVVPEFEAKFDIDFAEKKLQQYRLESQPPMGRGPIVFCLDVSGSMNGDRDMWAKALFAGVAELALKQRRWCHAIQFDHAVQRIDTFDPKAVDPLKFLECVAHFTGGNTNFTHPLNAAIDAIEAVDSKFKKADIVFLTDGEAHASGASIARLRAVQAKNPVAVHGVLVGGDCSGYTMRDFCDEVTLLPDVIGAALDTADKLFSKLV